MKRAIEILFMLMSINRNAGLVLAAPPPAFLNAADISRRPLSWAGKCVDAQGVKVEFPVTSHPGGTR